MQKSTKQLHVVILKDKSVDPLSRQTYIQPGGQIETDRETERQRDRQRERHTPLISLVLRESRTLKSMSLM